VHGIVFAVNLGKDYETSRASNNGLPKYLQLAASLGF
jgi:hypothetical protein